MGCGHDLYVNDKVLDYFCEKHNIDIDECMEINYYDWERAAKEAIDEYNRVNQRPKIRPDRMARFTWGPGELKIIKKSED